jgi:8-oxo-dGTP pyrophosphatase MutT (NUDIX family)
VLTLRRVEVVTTENIWTRLERVVAFEGRTTLVNHTVMLGDGTRTHYEVDESIPFAVAALLVDGDSVLLTRQFRYPLGQWIFDLPGGAGEVDEQPIDAARRELEEELGLVANELRPLHTFYPHPGRSAWPVHIFVSSSGTTAGTADRSDPAEQVRMVRMGVQELDERISSGEIVDPSLIVARTAAAVSGALPPLVFGPI